MADGSLSHPKRSSYDLFSKNLKELHLRVGYIETYLLVLVRDGLPDCPTVTGKNLRKIKEVFAQLYGLTQDVKKLLPPA